MKKNILVAGSSGYVGGIITEYFKEKYEIYRLDSDSCDLRSETGVANLSKKISPDIIIHAAGNKDIKFCEANPKEAHDANELSVINLVKAFPEKTIIYISSDYVFAGNGGNYAELDDTAPKTVYGKSKLAGETYGLKNSDSFIVLRASAIFDEKASFPVFLHGELLCNRDVACFANTFYSPTYYEDFLATLEKIIENGTMKNKIYHSCGERVSRHEFGITYAEVFGFDRVLIKKKLC